LYIQEVTYLKSVLITLSLSCPQFMQ
jgi:hypothetical protein